MAKTAAQRQAESRRRRPFAGPDGNGERRLNTFISTKASLALERLAARYSVTKREMVERLICAADDEVLASLDLDSPEWNQYLDKVKPSGVTA